VPALDVADRREDVVVAERADGLVEADLVVAHAGAAVREQAGPAGVGEGERLLDDDVAVRDEQRVDVLVELAADHQRDDDAVPDRLGAVVGDVLDGAELARAGLDVGALGRVDAAGVDEQGDDVVAALAQVRHAEGGVEAAGEGEDDRRFLGGHGITARR
jgi:hypothetical protein